MAEAQEGKPDQTSTFKAAYWIWVLHKFIGQSKETRVGWRSTPYPKKELPQHPRTKGMWWFCCRLGVSEERCRVDNNPIHTMYGNLKCILCHLQELKLIGLDIPHFAADLPLNRCKNRYTNILPCKIVNSADPTYVFQRLKDDYCRLIRFASLWLWSG